MSINRTLRTAIAVLALAGATLAVTGCATVQPWQRACPLEGADDVRSGSRARGPRRSLDDITRGLGRRLRPAGRRLRLQMTVSRTRRA